MRDSVSDYVLDQPDLLDREKQVLEDVAVSINFKVSRRLGDSRYWTKNFAGAIFYQGTYHTQPAVLKIQGTKPPVSEIDQIKNFTAQNRSKTIRPPKLYASISWNEVKQYEALILEYVEGTPVVSLPAKESEIKHFYRLNVDYRRHCRQRPWLPKPKHSISQQIKDDFVKWRRIRAKLFPAHPLFQLRDDELIDQAIVVLTKRYQGVRWDFCHAHLSRKDFVQTPLGEVILFSNLFWRYRQPLYDAVFAQHWHILNLSSLKNLDQTCITDQHQLWLKYLHHLPQTQGKHRHQYLYLALLERAAASLNLDILSLDPDHRHTPLLFDFTRQNLQYLIDRFN